MKSFFLGISTLFALSSAPAIAQAQYADPQLSAETTDPAVGPELGGESEYAPEAMNQQPAQAFGYLGPHPISNEQGGGFCQQQGAHEHPFPVFDQNLFRMVNGYAAFIGDPADFGYQNQVYMYRNEHPLDEAYGGGFCYIHWAHNHWFAPVSASFSWDGGAYAYTGAWGPDFYANRPLFVNYYDNYYRRNYLGGLYFSRRPSPIYAGWGWQRPLYRPGFQSTYRPGWQRPYAPRPGYGFGGQVYRGPGYGGPINRGPVYGQPGSGYRGPVYGAPVNRGPVYGQPGSGYRGPVYGGPVNRGPVYGQPGSGYRGPVYGGPVNRGPVFHAQAPAYHAPAFHGSAPAYHAPAFHGSAPAFHGGGHFGRR